MGWRDANWELPGVPCVRLWGHSHVFPNGRLMLHLRNDYNDTSRIDVDAEELRALVARLDRSAEQRVAEDEELRAIVEGMERADQGRGFHRSRSAVMPNPPVLVNPGSSTVPSAAALAASHGEAYAGLESWPNRSFHPPVVWTIQTGPRSVEWVYALAYSTVLGCALQGDRDRAIVLAGGWEANAPRDPAPGCHWRAPRSVRVRLGPLGGKPYCRLMPARVILGENHEEKG